MKRFDFQTVLTAAVILALAVVQPGLSTQTVSLEECITAALADNPDLRASAERVQAAWAALGQARSAYYPMLGGMASYARTDNPPQAFFMRLNQRQASLQKDFNQPPDTGNWTMSLIARYRLYDFGQRELGVAMARDGAELARLAGLALRNELIFQVVRGYYSVLQAEAFRAAQLEAVATLEESLRIARERVKAGSAVKSDALSLEVQLAQAREELVRARNGVQLALAALNTVIGAEMVQTGAMAAEAAEPAEAPAVATLSLADRPEYLAARLAASMAQKGSSQARRGFLPSLNAFGSLDWNAGTLSAWERSYSVGLSVEAEFFDGGRRPYALSGARARQRAAAAEIDKAANELQFDYKSAALRAAEAWERLAVVRLCTSSAEEALRLARQRYEFGAADLAELLNAQAGLTGTRMRHAAALYDYLIACSDLERAGGQLVARYAGDE